MRYLYVIFIITITVSCSFFAEKKQCNEVKEPFIIRIDKIGSYCPKHVMDGEFVALSMYFYTLTERPPTCEYKTHSDFLGVPDTVKYLESAFNEDKQFWIDWYKKNKSEAPFVKGDSVYQVALEKVKQDKQLQ